MEWFESRSQNMTRKQMSNKTDTKHYSQQTFANIWFLLSVDFCHMDFFAAWQKTKQRRFAACCDGRNWAELLEEQTPGVTSGSDLIRRRVQTGWQIRDDFLLLSSLNPPLVALTADSLQRFPVYQFSRVVVTLSKLVDFLCAALSLCIDTQQSWDYYAVYISGSFCVGW